MLAWRFKKLSHRLSIEYRVLLMFFEGYAKKPSQIGGFFISIWTLICLFPRSDREWR